MFNILNNLTSKQKELLSNNKIDTLLFYITNNDINFQNSFFILNNKKYNIIHFDIINFYDLLSYLNPSTVYMNKFNGYNYDRLIGDYIDIRSQHKFKNYIKDYLPNNYDFNSNKKDLLIIKLDNL